MVENHLEQIPILGKVSRKVLSFQATSASSERKFSMAGNVVNPKRKCISCEMVDDLVVLRSSKRYFA
ncbi:unnamed protein product [Discosporangium mesarthrocarpum]